MGNDRKEGSIRETRRNEGKQTPKQAQIWTLEHSDTRNETDKDTQADTQTGSDRDSDANADSGTAVREAQHRCSTSDRPQAELEIRQSSHAATQVPPRPAESLHRLQSLPQHDTP